jgi:hypothetical protein
MGAAALPLFIASSATQAAGKLASGLSSAAQSRAQAHMYDTKAITDAQASSMQEDNSRSDLHRLLGERVAQTAQNGGGFGGSAGMVLDQMAVDGSKKILGDRWAGLTQVDADHAQSLFERAKARAQTQGAFFDSLESGLSSWAQGANTTFKTK